MIFALKKSGIPQAVRKDIHDYAVTTAIERQGDVLMDVGCYPHSCDTMHYRLFLNAVTGSAAVCHFENGANWYFGGRSTPLALRGQTCILKNWRGAPAEVSRALSSGSVGTAQAVERQPQTYGSALGSGGAGRITGEFDFPSDYIPEDITACAEPVAGGREICSGKAVRNGGDVNYSIALPPGRYRVYARTADSPGYKAYYSQHVLCGGTANCADHTPIIVAVAPGAVRSGVNPNDWYAR